LVVAQAVLSGLRMPRPKRTPIVDGAVVAITSRTFQSQHLMVPTDEVNDAIDECLARALHLYPVLLHYYIFMSNHFHLLVTPPSPEVLADFMRALKSLIAVRVGLIVGWQGTFWGGRYHSAPVVDDTSEVRCVRYLLSHGCKECLVERPEQWPGNSSLKAMLDGTVTKTKWTDRAGLNAARRRHKDPLLVKESDYIHEYEIRLTPIPAWAKLPVLARQRVARALVDEIVRETERANKEAGRSPLGADQVRAKDPLSRPEKSKRSRAPLVHAATREGRLAFLAMRRAWNDEYRRAIRMLEAGAQDVEFPPSAFLPPRLRLPQVRGSPSRAPDAAPRCRGDGQREQRRGPRRDRS
jgi:putative transposase